MCCFFIRPTLFIPFLFCCKYESKYLRARQKLLSNDIYIYIRQSRSSFTRNSDVNPKKKTIVNFYHPFLCVWLLFIIIPNSFTIPVLKIYINILKYVWRASVRFPSVDEWLTRLIFFYRSNKKWRLLLLRCIQHIRPFSERRKYIDIHTQAPTSRRRLVNRNY